MPTYLEMLNWFLRIAFCVFLFVVIIIGGTGWMMWFGNLIFKALEESRAHDQEKEK